MSTTQETTAGKAAVPPDSEWIKTACGQCYIGCGVMVQVEDGVVLNVKGKPENPQNRGKRCARGKADS